MPIKVFAACLLTITASLDWIAGKCRVETALRSKPVNTYVMRHCVTWKSIVIIFMKKDAFAELFKAKNEQF